MYPPTTNQRSVHHNHIILSFVDFLKHTIPWHGMQSRLLSLTLLFGKEEILPGRAVHFRLEDPVEGSHGGETALQSAVGVGVLPVFHQQQSIAQPQDIHILE